MADTNIPESPEDRKARHTPGPWHRLPRGHMDMLGICDADGVFIAHVAEHSEEFSHADLIAAAPELLKETKSQRDLLLQIAGVFIGGVGTLADVEKLMQEEWDDVRSAEIIAKAEGE